jgi:glycosyltransferase involved in cell wall biosynthesis
MRILLVHNHYGDYAVGGEAMVMRAEAELLRSHGHEVRVYERSNAEIERRGVVGKLRAFLGIGWSREGYRAVAEEIRSFRPDVMHVHNYKYLLSPSVFGAAKDLGVSTVLTLHNYRLACPAGQFLRDGHVCEDCLNGFPYRMLWHRCASDNLVKNFCQFYLYWSTRRRKLLTPWVDAYIALSDFGKSRFVAAGLPQERIFVKPNFIDDPCSTSAEGHNPGAAIFVGRLSGEKGADTLVDAWRDIDYTLKIVGDGPLSESLRSRAAPQLRFEGALPHEDALKQIENSSFSVFPSVCYEGCPMTLLEAMALGKPVLATDLGPRCEMVRDGYNGFLYPPNDAYALRKKARELIENRELRERMGCNAREFYLAHYTPEKNYSSLMKIYKTAMKRSRSVK